MKIDASKAEKDLPLKPTACHDYKFLLPLHHPQFTVLQSSNSSHLDTKMVIHLLPEK